jgi:hypothetical protein
MRRPVELFFFAAGFGVGLGRTAAGPVEGAGSASGGAEEMRWVRVVEATEP